MTRALDRRVNGLIWQHRNMQEKVKALEERVVLHDQAILELDAALRRSGLPPDGSWALSLHPSESDPGRQSADAPSRLST